MDDDQTRAEDGHDEPADPTGDELDSDDDRDGGDDENGEAGEEPYERPIDRFRKGAVGSVVAAGLLGIGDALEGRAPKEEVTIVQEAPSQPHRGFDLVLDPEHPERSVVYLPVAEPTRRLPADETPDAGDEG
jgi:hypothetical protein